MTMCFELIDFIDKIDGKVRHADMRHSAKMLGLSLSLFSIYPIILIMVRHIIRVLTYVCCFPIPGDVEPISEEEYVELGLPEKNYDPIAKNMISFQYENYIVADRNINNRGTL